MKKRLKIYFINEDSDRVSVDNNSLCTELGGKGKKVNWVRVVVVGEWGDNNRVVPSEEGQLTAINFEKNVLLKLHVRKVCEL